MPEVTEMFHYDQNNNYYQYDLWIHCIHTVLGIDKSIDDDMLYLAALLHDIGKLLCICKSKREEDRYLHYYGHPEKSLEVVKVIIQSLIRQGTDIEKEEWKPNE